MPPKVVKQIQRHNLVFVAHITSLREVKASKNISAHVIAEFETKVVLKGKASKLKTLYGGFGGGSCRMGYGIGKDYLIFSNNSTTISHCSGSREIWSGNKNHQKFLQQIKSYVKTGKAMDMDFNDLN